MVLERPQTGLALDRELFRFRNPQFYPERAQLNQDRRGPEPGPASGAARQSIVAVWQRHHIY